MRLLIGCGKSNEWGQYSEPPNKIKIIVGKRAPTASKHYIHDFHMIKQTDGRCSEKDATYTYAPHKSIAFSPNFFHVVLCFFLNHLLCTDFRKSFLVFHSFIIMFIFTMYTSLMFLFILKILNSNSLEL